MATLIISPDISWSVSAQKAFSAQGLPCEVANTGKDAQLMAYHKPYTYFVLDLDVQNHQGIEVCKYLRKTCAKSKLIITLSSEKRLEEMLLDEKKLIKMGVTKVLYKPSPESIVGEIQEIGNIRKWKDLQEIEKPIDPEHDEEINDTEFARVKISDIFENELAVFDYYLRLSSNKFIKIFHRGEKPSKVQLDKYEASGTHFLYFKRSERANFISYQNDLAKSILKKHPKDSGKVVNAMKSTTDKYFEEIMEVGIQPKLLDEGKAICQNMYDAAVKDTGLKKFINDLEQFNPAALSHAFLVSFFSTLICKDLAWVGPKSVQTLALGALFHDIGILQLPKEMHEMDVAKMTAAQKVIYETHPDLGADAIKDIPGINFGVIQIVRQHHEYMNGTGFPSKITGHKIYPLAKVVALADGFSYFLKEHDFSPIEGLKVFLKNQNNLLLYDPVLVTNLIKALK